MTLLRSRYKDTQADELMRGELTSLNLGCCVIYERGAEIISQFLDGNDTVERVNLYDCWIGTAGGKAIAKALTHNETVEYLDLDTLTDVSILRNNVSYETMAAIDYLVEVRNNELIPNAVRWAALYLIATRQSSNYDDMGLFALLPKEIVKMIAVRVWATRKDSDWIEAVSTPANMEHRILFEEEAAEEYLDDSVNDSDSDSDSESYCRGRYY